MKRIVVFLSVFSALCINAAWADEYYNNNRTSTSRETILKLDTEDPLYNERRGDFLSRTGFTLGSDIFNVYQRFSYGFTNKFNLAADVKYQENFNSHDDGLSHIGVRASYRVADTALVTDIFGGINFNGDGANMPSYASTVYSIGARSGWRWNSITLAGTLQTSWIFHEDHGMAFIDMSPEVYFRMGQTWTSGLSATIRKSTTPSFDQEWVAAKLGKRYGRTVYMGIAEYEFEHSESRFGLRISILF